MGWLLVIYDLPVVEELDRKAATKFRRDIMDVGFSMLQQSVYIKPCVTHSKIRTAVKKIKKIAPAKGKAQIIFLTDCQWAKSEVIVGEIKPEMPRQTEFWELL